MSYIFCYGPSQKSELSVLLPDIRLYLQGQESCEGWASTDESWDKLQDHRKYKLFFVNDSRQKDFFINCERWRLKTHFKPCEMTYCSLVEVGKDWRKKLKAEWKKKKRLMWHVSQLRNSLMQPIVGSANSSMTSGPKHTTLLQRSLAGYLTWLQIMVNAITMSS